jgi:bifunctional non-homologous end joining protein LigD
MPKTAEIRRYGERDVKLTNLGKVLFPADGITKADLIAHVVACQAPLLAALRRRPLSMERRVDGLNGPGFFHKHLPAHFPEWVHAAETPTSRGPMRQVVVDDLATLVLVTNFGCLTPHVPTATVDRPHHPDHLVVDLDPPDTGADVGRIREAARLTRAALGDLPAFPRWTGSRGLHVVVPLDGTADGEAVAQYARRLAHDLVRSHPSLFTVEFAKVDRKDRIYVDVGRNQPLATCAVSYAVRPRPRAPIVAPITWDELDHTGPTTFTLRDAPARLAADPWRGYEAARGRLTA